MSARTGERLTLGRAIGLTLIALYRLTLGLLLGGRCRFAPSCSRYAEAAIHEHGLWRGGALALARLLRCHPFNPGGFDPVPPALPFRGDRPRRFGGPSASRRLRPSLLQKSKPGGAPLRPPCPPRSGPAEPDPSRLQAP